MRPRVTALQPVEPRSTLPLAVVDAFLDPPLQDLARQIRGGASLRAVTQVRWAEATAQHARTHVEAWLRSGDLAHLYDLLQTDPHALGLPVVVRLVYRLRQLASLVEEEEAGVPVVVDKEDVPDGACKAAAEALKSLASAVVSGLFKAPGWNSQRPRKRGRPKRHLAEELWDHAILADYDDVLGHLRARKDEFKCRQDEPQDRWIARLTKLIAET